VTAKQGNQIIDMEEDRLHIEDDDDDGENNLHGDDDGEDMEEHQQPRAIPQNPEDSPSPAPNPASSPVVWHPPPSAHPSTPYFTPATGIPAIALLERC